MSDSRLWLAADACADPMRVPEGARAAMAGAARVEVEARAQPALALWAPPERVRRLEGTDEPAADAPGDIVHIGVGRAPGGPAWQAVGLEPPPAAVDGSLRGATVVVTRPWQDIVMGAPAYAARGARVLPWPLSALAPPPDPQGLERATAAVLRGRYAAVGVTSARAAQAWCAAFRPAQGGAHPFLVAVGEATAGALVAGGLAPDLVTEGGGEAMGDTLGLHAAGGSVLLVAAAGGRTDAEDSARAHGCQVDVVAAYSMTDPPWRASFDPWVAEALREAPARSVYVTWFSPRGIERGFRVLGAALLDAAWVAVGRATAEAARAQGTPRGGIEVADVATANAVREAVVRLHRGRARR